MATEPTEQDREQVRAMVRTYNNARFAKGQQLQDIQGDFIDAIAAALHEREEQTRRQDIGKLQQLQPPEYTYTFAEVGWDDCKVAAIDALAAQPKDES